MVEIDMAIIIPSSKMYNPQNAKIRDNVIERIEVNAIHISQSYNYNVNVFTQKIEETDFHTIEEQTEVEKSLVTGGSTAGTYGVVYLKIIPIFYQITFYVDKNQNKNWITNINKSNVTVSEKYKIQTGNLSAQCILSNGGSSKNFENIVIGNLEESDLMFGDFLNSIDYNHDFNWADSIGNTHHISVNIQEEFKEIYSLSKIQNINILEDTDNYAVNATIFGGYQRFELGGYKDTTASSLTVDLKGIYRLYFDNELQISFNGNFIGINLTDKTVYINGETAKKVHEINGNELMQISNYYSEDNGKTKQYSTITNNFEKTQSLYAKGKETAVIRCSISDYYDENGEKIISIDKSTGRMSFKEYDEVIPMVYGADRKDYPMSLVNGKAKMFQILGTKKYYDGAVWQELSLQEVGELELPEEEPEVQQLTAPTIALDGDILSMTATDNKTQKFVIFVDGVEKVTVGV